MPLAAALSDMSDALGDIQTLTEAGFLGEHVGQEWDIFGEAFFKNGLNPTWTPAGLEAGKAAFAAAFGATVEADDTAASLATALQNGFQAFGALASVPTNAAPGIAGQLIPISPPPAPPVLITISTGASEEHAPLAAEILPKLLTWAATGLVSVTTPGGPVPTTPWS